MAAPVVASVGTATFSSGSVSSVAIPYPSGISSGDLLVLLAGERDDFGISTPTDWTLIDSLQQNTVTGANVFYKRATGSESGSLTVSRGGSGTAPMGGCMIRVTGAIAAGNPTGGVRGEGFAQVGVGNTADWIPADLDPPDAQDRLMLALGFANSDLLGESGQSLTGGTATLSQIFHAETTQGSDATIAGYSATHTAATVFDFGSATTAAAHGHIWFSLAILPAAGGGAFTLDAQPGSFALTGTAATPLAGRNVNAQPASYQASGVAAGVPAGRVVNAQPGSYAMSGADAGTLAARLVNAATGSYALTGTAAGTVAGRALSADPGVYTVTGFDAELVYTPLGGAFELNAEPGVYTLTGAIAGTLAARILVGDPGSYTLTGTLAGVTATRLIGALPASYTVTGFQAQVGRVFDLNAEPGGYSITGSQATFSRTLLIVATAGAYTVTGADADLVRTAQEPTMDPILTGWIALPASGGSGRGTTTGRISTPETGEIA
jgi:hypothetical protein